MMLNLYKNFNMYIIYEQIFMFNDFKLKSSLITYKAL